MKVRFVTSNEIVDTRRKTTRETMEIVNKVENSKIIREVAVVIRTKIILEKTKRT